MFKRVFLALIKDRLALIGVVIVLGFVGTAAFAPYIAPFDPNAVNRVDGKVARLVPPNGTFWFGTTDMGRDVFSQVVMGLRVGLEDRNTGRPAGDLCRHQCRFDLGLLRWLGR